MKANDIRRRSIIKYKGNLYRVLDFSHVKPGKGGAYIQVELKSITNGTKENHRFRSSETVESPFMESKEFVYLFSDNESITLLNTETCDQIELNKDIISESAVQFLKEDMTVTCLFCEDQIIECTLPKKITMKIKSCDAYIKNQTATPGKKHAVLENGYTMNVPVHLKNGDEIIIDTENFEYVELSKNVSR